MQLGLDGIEEEMKQCFQTSGVSVWRHGEMVWEKLQEFIRYLHGEPLQSAWRLPDWAITYRSELLNKLLPEDILKTYALYHDCGKPFCRTVDADGKQHFPDHAKKSEEIWIQMREQLGYHQLSEQDAQIGKLIGMDMVVHTMKADDIPEFIKHPEAMSLLCTGLAEIHANAEMFGGIDSLGFKMKFKQIEKRGNAICKIIF